jgi:hypothetical protein
MSTSQWPNAVDEQDILEQTTVVGNRADQLKAQADPALAKKIGDIYRQNPWMKPGEILALAKGNASPEALNRASELSARATQTRLDPDNQPKSWWQRNVVDKVKTTTRWTFAALNLAPELTTNLGSQLFSSTNPEGFDGWFKSTTFGSLMADPTGAGDGYFVGGQVAEKQSERARRFRGTINGQAWTVGRGSADVFFTPGSKEYNLLSGVVDAAVNVFADPTIVAGKALAGAKTARAALPSIQTAEEISAFAKAAERGLAGLDEAEKIAWNGSKFRQFFTSDKRSRRLVEALTESDDEFDILSRIFDYKIDLDTAMKFKDAKTTDEVIGIIGQAADRMNSEVAGILPTDIRDIRGARFGTMVKEKVPGYNSWRNSRLFTDVPDQVLVAGSTQDRIKAVKSYANYLDTIGVKTDSIDGRNFMKKVIDTYRNPNEINLESLDGTFNELVTLTLKKDLGDDIGEIAAKGMFQKVRQVLDQTKAYFVDELGEMYDGNIIKANVDSGMIDLPAEINPADIDKWVMSGPGSVVEMMDTMRVLPDFRGVRRLTANPFVRRALSNRAGDPRGAIAVTEYLQNEIWKPLTLATGGYIMRNMFDAQIRMATVGKASFFRHPVDYIYYVMGKKAPTNIFGRDWDTYVQKVIDGVDDDIDNFAESMSFGLQRNLIDPVQASRRAVRTGSYKIVDKAKERELWDKGLIDELRQVSQDTIMNAVAKGIPREDILTYLRDPKRPKGARQLESLKKYLQNGVPIKNKETGEATLVKFKEVTDDVLLDWVYRLAEPRVALKSGGDETIRFATAYRQIPNGPRSSLDPNDLLPKNFIDGPKNFGKGSLIEVPGEPGVAAIITDVGDGSRYTIQRVSGFDIWDTPEGRQEFAELVKRVADTQGNRLPNKVKYAEREIPKGTLSATEENVIGLKNRAVDFFFDRIYGTAVRKFERSPLFRQSYYENIVNNADLLSPSEANALLSRLTAAADSNGVSIQNLVGGKANFKKLEKALANSKGTGTMEQLEEFASIKALNFTKETLYNAAERNNLEDVLRILMPFGSAYREVMTKYAGFLVENPARIRRAQQVYTGLTGADPENDGRGFFYKDPVSGENMFTFPFSGKLAKLATGVEAPLVGRVKGLSMGFQVVPGFGPAVQIAASQLAPDTPKLDGLLEYVLPYGRKGFGSLVPGYVSKMTEAFRANPNKLDGIYANTYMETVQALAATGEYDLADPNEKIRLFDDAKPRARVLTFMRAASQFIGPTSGTSEFMVETKGGDMMASVLVAEFQRLNRENPDTAVEQFLDIFGDDAYLYMSGKTQAQVGGLSASDQFGDWERQNGDLFKKYPEAAAYFAPAGDDFSYATYERQIRTGKRKRLTDDEMVELAQRRVGSAIYRNLKQRLGTDPTPEQREWLANARKEINKRLPGFPEVATFTVGEFDNTVKQIREAASDASLDGNNVAKAVREYMRYRDQAYAEVARAGNKDIRADKFENLRQWLYNIGTAIGQQEPGFLRVWDELSSEVD